jgi:hypothetical protein
VVTRHSVGDQKQIFGGIGQDHVQKLPILRVVVTAAAVLLTAFAYQRTKTFSVWIGVFLGVAAVFNPIVPLHLTRWSILNIAAGALFVGRFVVDRHRGKQKDGICTKAE